MWANKKLDFFCLQHHMQHRNIKVNRAFKETLFQDLHDKHNDKKVTFEKREFYCFGK